MRVEYINPFVETSFRVLQEVLGGAEVKRGDLYLKSTAMPVMGVAALVGLAGDVEGRVLFDMTMETALNIASAMNGETLPELSLLTLLQLRLLQSSMNLDSDSTLHHQLSLLVRKWRLQHLVELQIV